MTESYNGYKNWATWHYQFLYDGNQFFDMGLEDGAEGETQRFENAFEVADYIEADQEELLTIIQFEESALADFFNSYLEVGLSEIDYDELGVLFFAEYIEGFEEGLEQLKASVSPKRLKELRDMVKAWTTENDTRHHLIKSRYD
tara:strand:- start:752 stop:1183 length:432 start_codon:yes stop_codon:yes gene_type:complete